MPLGNNLLDRIAKDLKTLSKRQGKALTRRQRVSAAQRWNSLADIAENEAYRPEYGPGYQIENEMQLRDIGIQNHFGPQREPNPFMPSENVKLDALWYKQQADKVNLMNRLVALRKEMGDPLWYPWGSAGQRELDRINNRIQNLAHDLNQGWWSGFEPPEDWAELVEPIGLDRR